MVQHALCDEVLAPVLEPRLIYDNAASRRGKGTGFALDRLSGFLRDFHRAHGTGGYMLKFDVRSCCRSIDHAVLKRLFDGYFYYDPRVRWLVGRIIDSFADAPGKGIPLGNQASSWFAISYLVLPSITLSPISPIIHTISTNVVSPIPQTLIYRFW